MAESNRIVSMLQEQRRQLLHELSAIDRAIAAACGEEAPLVQTPPPVEPAIPGDPATGEALPQKVAARRVLSDEHKYAVADGKRRARHAREAARGLARDLPDEDFVPAIQGRGEGQPRLVKGPAIRP